MKFAGWFAYITTSCGLHVSVISSFKVFFSFQNGRLKHKDIGHIWKDFPAELHEWLLRLTEEFDLTFPLPDKAMNLVPCLLPEKEPGVSLILNSCSN
jgi:hypothetical protein